MFAIWMFAIQIPTVQHFLFGTKCCIQDWIFLPFCFSIQKFCQIQKQIIPRLTRLCIPVLVSRNHPWTLEPWHVRASMRKLGLEVAEPEAVKLPENPISGPNEDLESKEFPVSLKVMIFILKLLRRSLSNKFHVLVVSYGPFIYF